MQKKGEGKEESREAETGREDEQASFIDWSGILEAERQTTPPLEYVAAVYLRVISLPPVRRVRVEAIVRRVASRRERHCERCDRKIPASK